MLLPGAHGLVDGIEDLARDVDHDGTFGFEGTKYFVVLLVVGQFVEEEVYFLENWLPPEDQVVEVVDDHVEVAFEDIFFEGVGFVEVESIDNDLQDGNEYVSAGVEQVKSQVLKIQIQTFKTTRFSLFD